MEIDDDKKRITQWMDNTLTTMAMSMPVGEKTCPHCCVPIRHPIIVRQSDIDLFAEMMRVAYRAMDEYGITPKLPDNTVMADMLTRRW